MAGSPDAGLGLKGVLTAVVGLQVGPRWRQGSVVSMELLPCPVQYEARCQLELHFPRNMYGYVLYVVGSPPMRPSICTWYNYQRGFMKRASS